MFGIGDYISKEEEEEMDRAIFKEAMDEILPQLDPLFDEDEAEWLEILKEEEKKGNFELGEPIFYSAIGFYLLTLLGGLKMKMDKIHTELTELHIMVLYDFMDPVMSGTNYTADQINWRKEQAIKRYQNDPFFHARVEKIVALSMDIIRRNQ